MEKVVNPFVETLWKTKQLFFQSCVLQMTIGEADFEYVSGTNVSICKIVNLFSYSSKKIRDHCDLK